ncbi:MAG: hypothetical protein ABW168_03570 [Sedimenticola sp.]
MNNLLEGCESWLKEQYRTAMDRDIDNNGIRLRWLTNDSLTRQVDQHNAGGLLLEDGDIGWLFYLLPYSEELLQKQVNQALGIRSRLLREANYTGKAEADVDEDKDSTWRVGIIWLVDSAQWDNWQEQILDIRRESGVVEEISIDVVRINDNDIVASLTKHGMPRLLLHTRAMMKRLPHEAEKWLSADAQVLASIDGLSEEVRSASARQFARELEEKAKGYTQGTILATTHEPRHFSRFRVESFRNIESLEIAPKYGAPNQPRAVIMFGPNGTGKTSFTEAVSLAAFHTSPRLESFLLDKDVQRRSEETYLNEYVAPTDGGDRQPSFQWGSGGKVNFTINTEDNLRSYDGVILNQEDSLRFFDVGKAKLAELVLRGYSALADNLTLWLDSESARLKEIKHQFTREYNLNNAITRSATAYDRLAQGLLEKCLNRPPAEYLNWLRFIASLSRFDTQQASSLLANWDGYQQSEAKRLSATLAKLQEQGASTSEIADTIKESLYRFDRSSEQSIKFREEHLQWTSSLRNELETIHGQMDSWGEWLGQQQEEQPANSERDSEALAAEIDSLAKERADLEKHGKALRGRIDLLENAKQYLGPHWAKQHPDTCPVCDSDVSDRNGIEQVVATLLTETDDSIIEMRSHYAHIQTRQKDLEMTLKVTSIAVCPIAVGDQKRLNELLQPFLRDGMTLKVALTDPQQRQKLKEDLSRMSVLPDAPQPHTDPEQGANELANRFIELAQEADKALEDPQALGEVRKAYDLRLEKVMKEHLPSTMEKVWSELTMTLTTAPWLLPEQPKLKLERRGKMLSIQAGDGGRYIRYLYNSAEKHILELAWFYTNYLAKRRFDEAWMLLDDPAQEMDQPSYRELVRLWETLLRLHQRYKLPLTMIVALHQEERALDATRATNGELYILGWQKKQRQDSSPKSSVKRVELLAPGYFPLKPDKVFEH